MKVVLKDGRVMTVWEYRANQSRFYTIVHPLGLNPHNRRTKLRGWSLTRLRQEAKLRVWAELHPELVKEVLP